MTLRKLPIQISQEIKHALASKSTAVVALESTIITHGLPFPKNVEMALSVEEKLRSNGVIPATCAFIQGKPHIGLTSSQLEQLAESTATKTSRRDIGYVMANKLNGGTTIASTMTLSHMAGIKVFATGGLGGVHRDGQFTMDVSADLTELGRTPVSVVCAGPKSILDIGLTMEYLETQGVYVGTFNESKLDQVEVPGFYCRNSGIVSPFTFNSFTEAASIIHNQSNMGLQTGNVFCIPPPIETALDSKYIAEIIETATQLAETRGIKGKKLTPFLLSQIAEQTQGKSIDCNLSLVYNNAIAGAEIAKELLALENHVSTYVPEILTRPKSKPKRVSAKPKDLLIVGSIALDTIAKMNQGSKLHDSNPGTTTNSIGGVGYNIFLASKYAGANSKLVSQIGQDFAGKFILDKLTRDGIDTSAIQETQGNTAQYTSIHDSQGELVVACADMSIIETDFSSQIIQEITHNQPKIVALDCNLSPTTVSKILPETPSVILDPTSHIKAKRISQLNLQCYPNNKIKLITPTIQELNSIYESFQQSNHFNDLDNWFPILDSFNINSNFRDKLDRINIPIFKKLLSQGIFQQSFHLLPYFQNVLVKLGDQGVVLISLSSTIDDYKSIPTTSQYRPELLLTSQGMKFSEGRMGVSIEYFPIPKENENLNIVNVTGAGDSFFGYLAASLSKDNWLGSEIKDIEQVWNKWECIYKCQLASGLSLISTNAVSEEISKL
ncbi:hypothetical protein JA1_001307 [Spathaspora sp. JA1]|nr:hypothetical protein JA1_001307 [Spathaspora sp. JA1]